MSRAASLPQWPQTPKCEKDVRAPRRPYLLPCAAAVIALAAALSATLAGTALAAPGPAAFSASLPPADKKLFEAYLSAKALYDFKLDAYWRDVVDTRGKRRIKRKAGRALGPDDYVRTFPPEYDGPVLPPDLAKRWAAYQEKTGVSETRPSEPIPGLDVYLAEAKARYNFEPERIPEREFKLRYAREALSLGLTKEQVVRVYALETSGLGTADMVSGIHPIKKTGKPISTALGYAQLLAANTTDELVQHGSEFIARLSRMAAEPGIDPARRAALEAKIAALRKMYAAARSVPHEWDAHVAFAKTPRGLGIHAINLDGDIGPWLQVVKLKGLRLMAERAGMMNLTGAEIELMNLAGPGTGLEMMTPAGRDAPTPNFFARAAYGRNTIVRGKTSAELMAALDKRMQDNITNSGAIEFAEVFDQAAAEREAAAR